jgi:hypothetical protein
MRLAAALLGFALIVFSGCAGLSPRGTAGEDAGVAASPGPDLMGVWRGTAFAVPGSSHLTSTPVELRISDDGTWAWTSQGVVKAHGTVARRGDRLILHAAENPSGTAEPIQLQHRGDHLWGVSRYFIPGAMSAVDLRHQGSTR